jgi:3-oxoacyl-[acyl-carrier protein] reductase
VGRPSAKHEQLERELRQADIAFQSFACDLADSIALEATARQVVVERGTPQALINNAGVVRRSTIVETDNAAYDEQLAVNLRAPFVLTRTLLPSMLQAGEGRIVQVGSISSTLGSAGGAAYCASKWGLVGFMKSLAEELTGSGLMTVAVLPGSVDTPMLEGSGFEPRMSAEGVASTLAHYALDAGVAHNGGVIEMFGT